MKQGDLARALTSYRKAQGIREILAARDPGNADWQRDLSISYNNVGNVQMKQRDLAGALASYRNDYGIAETLAARDPGNTEWQGDLSVSYNKVGDVQLKQGDLAGALASYRRAQGIARHLGGARSGQCRVAAGFDCQFGGRWAGRAGTRPISSMLSILSSRCRNPADWLQRTHGWWMRSSRWPRNERDFHLL